MTPTGERRLQPVRTWRITRSDETTIEVRGRKPIIMDNGCLLIMAGGPQDEYRNIFAQGAWLECEPVPTSRPGPRS